MRSLLPLSATVMCLSLSACSVLAPVPGQSGTDSVSEPLPPSPTVGADIRTADANQTNLFWGNPFEEDHSRHAAPVVHPVD
ncbi:hypothetical protein [Stomatohabitans albus]|uniref:hypothetical protein n=1 Tax=Stomatohabitans albus TaxID=3110766 RepID=UPI00300D6575